MEALMSTERIRELNDAFRKSFKGGKVVTTQGVAALDDHEYHRVLQAVQEFDDFSSDNDPHGEHDFGSFEYHDQKFFWKTDLYEEADVKDANGDPVVTRVLTIMLADDC
jgi:hypothetical protein